VQLDFGFDVWSESYNFFLPGAPLFLVVKLSVLCPMEGRVGSYDKKRLSGSQLSKSREAVP
jgi:hypothetical protein